MEGIALFVVIILLGIAELLTRTFDLVLHIAKYGDPAQPKDPQTGSIEWPPDYPGEH